MKLTIPLIGIVILMFGCATRDVIEFNPSSTSDNDAFLYNGESISIEALTEITVDAKSGEIDILIPLTNGITERVDYTEWSESMDCVIDAFMSAPGGPIN